MLSNMKGFLSNNDKELMTPFKEIFPWPKTLFRLMAKLNEFRPFKYKMGWPKTIVFGQGSRGQKVVKLKFRVMRFKGLKSLFKFHLVNFYDTFALNY